MSTQTETVLTTATDTTVLQRGHRPVASSNPPTFISVEEEQVTFEAVKEDDPMEVSADKKTDVAAEPKPQGGYLWRFSSGVYSVTTGAVSGAASAGVTGAKWVAGTGVNVGSAIYSKVPTVSWKRKDKKE